MTATATGMLTRASRSITTAVDLGATTADVMLATVVGLRRHDHPVSPDRADSRALAKLYPSLLGSAAEGEPTIADLMADDVEPDVVVVESSARPGHFLPDDVPAPRRPEPVANARAKRHYPHRRAMTLRLGVERWRRLRQAAVDTDSNQTDVINAALDRHFAYLDSKKRRAAVS